MSDRAGLSSSRGKLHERKRKLRDALARSVENSVIYRCRYGWQPRFTQTGGIFIALYEFHFNLRGVRNSDQLIGIKVFLYGFSILK